MTPAWTKWLLGIEQKAEVVSIGNPHLAAGWARDQFFWLVVLTVACFLLAVLYYIKGQTRKISRPASWTLGIVRGITLTLLLVTLASPAIQISRRRTETPTLFIVFDGTESMSIEDRWSDNEQQQLAKALDVDAGELGKHRQALVQQWLSRQDNVLKRLAGRSDLRVEAFLFGAKSSPHLRPLNRDTDNSDWKGQLSSDGQVTSLGRVLTELMERSANRDVAGIIVVSDFSHNSGQHPTRGSGESLAARLPGPVYTIGVGASKAVDLSVELQTDPRMKLAEETQVIVRLRQTGLTGRQVELSVVHEVGAGQQGEPIVITRQQLQLEENEQQIRLPYIPQVAGAANFKASVKPLDEEMSKENNTTSRSVRILDDYLRLMYISDEPTWEWRFIKEVFHRDNLVGLRGFRTFLSSSDPEVREANELFLPTMTPARSEFFANDVIFIEDMPPESLTPRFSQMVQQFVSELGGGLVVMVGPRFGTEGLRNTGIEQMLPVILEPQAPIRDKAEFALRRTSLAPLFEFMQLGDSPTTNEAAWKMLQRVPWYQPVRALSPGQASVLAEHPTDKLSDGKTPQPLITHRRYGKGQVVLLSFNETWRLRRRYGEKHYRQFWSQLIYRLGMSHALGNDKRFVTVLGQDRYEVEERLRFRVEAYDKNYQPLRDEDVAGGSLQGELVIPGTPAGTAPRKLLIPFVRRGVFETEIPLFRPGEYQIRVRDPIQNTWVNRRVFVSDRSAERRLVVRITDLQDELANLTGGKSYDLTSAEQLSDEIQSKPMTSTTISDHALWNTPLWFILLVSLLLGEWLARKRMHLV